MKDKYITETPKGYQVRLPKRVGGGSKFFAYEYTNGGLLRSLKAARAWRDEAFKQKDEEVHARYKKGQGVVFSYKDKSYISTWMYENKQVRRAFSLNVYGAGAYEVACMARDIGIRVELDRQQGT